MNNNYQMLSYYYDEIMHVMNYKDMLSFTKKYINPQDSILDLACGSGTLAILLKLNGFNVKGLDISETMITVAKEKSKMNHLSIPFIEGDMVSFKLDERFNCITCFFDSINMLDDIKKIKDMFKNVYDHLLPGGIFIFDVFSKSKYLDCKHLHFKEDLNWFKYDWRLRLKKPNMLIHKINITEGKKKIREEYLEYFYPYESLIDESLFSKIEISGDFKETFNDSDERVVVVLKKN